MNRCGSALKAVLLILHHQADLLLARAELQQPPKLCTAPEGRHFCPAVQHLSDSTH